MRSRLSRKLCPEWDRRQENSGTSTWNIYVSSGYGSCLSYNIGKDPRRLQNCWGSSCFLTRFGADDTLDLGVDVLLSAAGRAANADSRKQMREDGSALLSKAANSKPVTAAKNVGAYRHPSVAYGDSSPVRGAFGAVRSLKNTVYSILIQEGFP